ncbi:MAG: YbhB/YbcL family Raf kinase inhibitor-like protein [Actinomycetes bacterium]
MRIPETDAPDTIRVTSPAFADGEPVPREHTCRGAGGYPELSWRGTPGAATSIAIVVSDPDAPKGPFVHWVLHALPPGDGNLAADAIPPGAQEADNSAGRKGWYPPCPPGGTHHYLFTVYALDRPVSGGSTQEILDDIAHRALAQGTLTGLVSAG